MSILPIKTFSKQPFRCTFLITGYNNELERDNVYLKPEILSSKVCLTYVIYCDSFGSKIKEIFSAQNSTQREREKKRRKLKFPRRDFLLNIQIFMDVYNLCTTSIILLLCILYLYMMIIRLLSNTIFLVECLTACHLKYIVKLSILL